MSETDTIFALSSGRPPAAIAVIRVSGPQAGLTIERLVGRAVAPRQAVLATIRDLEGEALDQGLVLWFPGPASETGEDTAEFQIHGGRAVIAAALTALGRIDGLRGAEPGEFTRRALANGRLDLTAVEGLADLIGAETEAQRRQALGQLRGRLGRRAEAWRERLVSALAQVEAGLDFSDEGDVPAEIGEQALITARQLASEIEAVVATAQRGERLREGLTVALAGPVNAGKSSIFNWIAGREAAIVSPYPGTTRDVLEVHLDLDGYPVTILDTAGVRASDDPVEQEGIRRAQRRAADADLVLWVEDAGEPGHLPPRHPAGQQVWSVFNKIDRATREELRPGGSHDQHRSNPVFHTSTTTGEGLAALLCAITKLADDSLGGAEPALVTRARQREALSKALAALQRASKLGSGTDELFAEELRLASRALESLLGRIDVEDVLDVIFRDFCIGK